MIAALLILLVASPAAADWLHLTHYYDVRDYGVVHVMGQADLLPGRLDVFGLGDVYFDGDGPDHVFAEYRVRAAVAHGVGFEIEHQLATGAPDLVRFGVTYIWPTSAGLIQLRASPVNQNAEWAQASIEWAMPLPWSLAVSGFYDFDVDYHHGKTYYVAEVELAYPLTDHLAVVIEGRYNEFERLGGRETLGGGPGVRMHW